jgi:HlyD family secretion protein
MSKSKIFTFLKKRWKLLLILAVVLVGLWMWQQKSAASSTNLNFVEVKRGDIVSSITISGRVDAKEKARLRFAAGGKVVYLGAKEGDQVKKWQSIATIDRAALQKQLQQNLNLYMKERYDFENLQDDIKDQILDTRENRAVAKDQYDLDNQVLNVEIQSIAIQNTTLSAPFAGVLTVSPTAVAGVQLSPTDYFEVVNPETLIFRAAIDEIDLHRVSLGQASEIVLDAYEDEIISSNLSYISYVSSESSSGTVFLMEFPLVGADMSKYRLGMNGDAMITLAKKENVLMVPLDAISERDGKVYIQIKADNKEQVEDREIEIGLESDDEVEVISGLVEGDQILLPE